jgi:hypothetical protein
MMALHPIPIIGPAFAIMTIALWEAVRLGLIITGHPIAFATSQGISLVVFAFAF